MSDNDRDNSETVIIALALGTGCLVGAVCVVAFYVIKRLLAVRRRKRRAACQAPPRSAGRMGSNGDGDDNDKRKTAMASARASDVARASERRLRDGEQQMPSSDRAAGGRQPAVSSRPSDKSDRQRQAALDGNTRRQKAPAVLDGNTRQQKAPAAHNGARASGGDEHSAATSVARTAPVGYSDLTTVRRNYRQQQQWQQQQSSAGNNNEKQYGQRAVAPLGADGAHYESTVAAAIAAGATMESGGFTKHNLQW